MAVFTGERSSQFQMFRFAQKQSPGGRYLGSRIKSFPSKRAGPRLKAPPPSLLSEQILRFRQQLHLYQMRSTNFIPSKCTMY